MSVTAVPKAYQDVWSGDQDLCAYCAYPIKIGDGRCGQCRRSLIGHQYRYPEASTNLHVYWVLLLGLGQLFLVQLFMDLLRGASDAQIVADAILVGLFGALALGVYLRQFWAHLISVGLVALVALTLLLELLTQGAFSAIMGSETGRIATLSDLAASGNMFANSPFFGIVLPFQLGTALFALFFGIFRTGSDFDRVKIRYAAGVDPALREAVEFYRAGKLYAESGMWASAALYYQRAAAHDPHRLSYPCAVAHAFAHLGFYERSLDLLQSARKIAATPQARAEIEQLEAEVRQRLEQQ